MFRSARINSGVTRSARTKIDLVYEEKDELFDIGVGRSRDKKCFSRLLRENDARISLFACRQSDRRMENVLPREKDHEYAADFYNGEFYITTNKNAENFRVVARR
jgi:oligopeptidase B